VQNLEITKPFGIFASVEPINAIENMLYPFLLLAVLVAAIFMEVSFISDGHYTYAILTLLAIIFLLYDNGNNGGNNGSASSSQGKYGIFKPSNNGLQWTETLGFGELERKVTIRGNSVKFKKNKKDEAS
jgi:hypothetical protein